MKWFLWISLPLYVIDQITKEVVVRNFAAPGTVPGGVDAHSVVDGFFRLVRVHNTGVAFGKFNGGAYSNIIFSIIALAAVVAIVVFWKKNAFPTKMTKWAAALLLSGVLGNVTDRLARGYVVDFLEFDLGFMIWPSFNVADACICIAATLLFLGAFQTPPDGNEATKEAANPVTDG